MINTYTFFDSDVNKLHGFVLAFFNRIENETGDFSITFFEPEFYDNLVKRHKGILLKAFKGIYVITKVWDQAARTALCESIRRSNEIEQICAGNVTAVKANDIPEPVRELLTTLFIKLYKKVLFGDFFKVHYGDRRTHYHAFRQHANNGYAKCPACGFWPMHTSVDDITDQYDHYLPKDLYPFSSVNFANLVPICSDCNSLQVKSNDDVLAHTGKAFYPFSTTHQPITFVISISRNAPELENISWQVDYSCERGKDDELTAWKAIYKIESRHKNHVRGSLKSWHRDYWDYFNDKESIADDPDEAVRTRTYLRTKRSSSSFEHQALSAFLNEKSLAAISASKGASRY